MKLNKLAVVLLAVLAISFSFPAFTVQTAPTSEFLPEAMDIGPKLRDPHFEPELNIEITELEAETGYSGGASWPTIFDVKLMLWYDDWTGIWTEWFYLINYTDNVEIWMQADINYDPFFSGIDPDDRNPVEITEEQIDYFVTEFDNNIYPTVTDFFGVPDFHDGSNAELDDLIGAPSDYYYDPLGRTMVMISNIGDTYYRDPTFPSFIAGFYWGTYEYYFDRNIININADFWETHLYPTETGTGFVGTTAHEMQHLIHGDYSPGQVTFMNEACSTYAEYLCGYGIPWGDINWYMATPDNSLVLWGDQGPYNILADYGVVFLWAMYIQDHFGPLSWWPGFEGNFLGLFVQYGLTGISGLDAWFSYLSGGVDTFDSVFHDWRIANLLDSDEFNPRYSYPSIDLTKADPPRQYDVETCTFMYGSEFGTTLTIQEYDTGVSLLGMYGSDYLRITNPCRYRRSKFFMFDGADGVELWQEEEGVWYSGAYNLGNALLYGAATIGPEATLTFETYYDIEEDWDFGFIQISTDGGETWTSLTNDDTVNVWDANNETHPDIIAQGDGLTGYMDWTTMTFDLTGFEGEVLIGFRYMTDWFTTEEGWYVTNVMVDEEPVELIPALTPIEWQVTLVYYMKNRRTHELEPFRVRDVRLRDLCDLYNIGFSMITHKTVEVVAIISPVGFDIGFADYWFGYFGFKWGCWW